jgi:hypothetical protein
MSDQDPANNPRHPHGGGYQEWPHHAPPGVHPPQKDPQAVRRGVVAAAYIFGAAVAVHLATLAAVALMGGSDNAFLFLPEGILVVVVGLIAAIVVSVRLPMDSRPSFWLSGFAFMALQFIIWGVTCGIGFSTSPMRFN